MTHNEAYTKLMKRVRQLQKQEEQVKIESSMYRLSDPDDITGLTVLNEYDFERIDILENISKVLGKICELNIAKYLLTDAARTRNHIRYTINAHKSICKDRENRIRQIEMETNTKSKVIPIFRSAI